MVEGIAVWIIAVVVAILFRVLIWEPWQPLRYTLSFAATEDEQLPILFLYVSRVPSMNYLVQRLGTDNIECHQIGNRSIIGMRSIGIAWMGDLTDEQDAWVRQVALPTVVRSEGGVVQHYREHDGGYSRIRTIIGADDAQD